MGKYNFEFEVSNMTNPLAIIAKRIENNGLDSEVEMSESLKKLWLCVKSLRIII